MTIQAFEWEQRGCVGVVTLSRPERKNALTFEAYDQLIALFHKLAAEHSPRAIVITGAGGNFSSGADVHDILGPLSQRDMPGVLEFSRTTGRLILAIRACPQPVIAAVDGVCAGAGAAIAMASDLRLGTPRAKTAFLFMRLGLSGCDMGACSLLPKIIGMGRASELLLTGRVLEAEQGSQWGWFNRLSPPETLMDDAMEMARQLGEGPSFAHAMTKQMLGAAWTLSLENAIEAEAQAQAICAQSQDFRRGYAAFVAREKPRFEGN